MAPMSNAPSNAIEGGDFPRGDLLVTEAHFGVHKYTKKGLGKNTDGTDVMVQVMARNGNPAIAVVAYMTLRNDEGTEFPQFYSVGDPGRYTIAKDGSEIEKGDLKTNCNYYQLLKALVNAGYPEDKLREESKIAPLFVGMYAKWDQETEKRGDSSQLVLPLELHQFPWGPAVQGAPVAPAAEGGKAQTITASDVGEVSVVVETSAQVADDEAVIAKVVEAANAMLDDPETEGARKRDDLSMYIFKTRDKDEKMEMMGLIMNVATAAAFAAAGITLDGEELSK